MSVANTTVPNAPSPSAQYVEDFFVYEVDTLALAAGASIPVNVPIQADSDFKLSKISQFCDIALAAQTISTQVLPMITLQLTDTGSGRSLFSAPVPLANIAGTGQFPFILPIIRIFKARSNITVTLTNYSAATAYNVHVSLIGTKLFTLG